MSVRRQCLVPTLCRTTFAIRLDELAAAMVNLATRCSKMQSWTIVGQSLRAIRRCNVPANGVVVDNRGLPRMGGEVGICVTMSVPMTRWIEYEAVASTNGDIYYSELVATAGSFSEIQVTTSDFPSDSRVLFEVNLGAFPHKDGTL